jgi:hypothetical protein
MQRPIFGMLPVLDPQPMLGRPPDTAAANVPISEKRLRQLDHRTNQHRPKCKIDLKCCRHGVPPAKSHLRLNLDSRRNFGKPLVVHR